MAQPDPAKPDRGATGPNPATPAATSPGAEDPGGGTIKRHKNIVLFSDGTGNSSGKLFKTNVWRMYEAVDLGPTVEQRREQIAYYDSGVGTSGFKPLAVLGGVFGLGLRRNMLEIYRYACRNYRPGDSQQPGEDTTDQGDHLYGFGFSRGAFTMRLLIDFIADQGLVPYTSERELAAKSAAAWRCYRRGVRPRYQAFRLVFGAPFRLLGAALRMIRPVAYDPNDNYRPVIRFVGVWDTVAAYGGPIIEITRAIDNWITRLTPGDHKLHPRVQCARHALALDDERDSFHPVLWDELNELDLAAAKDAEPATLPAWIGPDRLEQVWFCGMHADVGGGYPDESLSFVSLLWMIDEAEKAGLETLELITDRYQALANSFGPMHNSRAGIAAYYRYQPRNVSAWLDPVEDSTLSLRDPAIRDSNGKQRGLLAGVKIHESVLARIASGTDRYAPFALPASFTVHPPGCHGENQPPGTSGTKGARRSLLSAEIRERMADGKRALWVKTALDAAWDSVWFRRWTYFLTLAATLLLATMPLWIAGAWPAPFLSDGRTWIGNFIGLLRLVTPGFMDGWVSVLEHNAFYTLILVLAIFGLLRLSTRIEQGLRDKARTAWRRALAKAMPPAHRPAPRSFATRLRTSQPYQRGLQLFKYHFMPLLIGIAMLGVFLWGLLAALTQSVLPFAENGSGFCSSRPSTKEIIVVGRDFETSLPCNQVGARVTRGVTYEISFHVVEDWADGTKPTTPRGLSAQQLGLAGYLGVPLRRVIGANYLQPIAVVRPTKSDQSGLRNAYLYPLDLDSEGQNSSVYRAQFTPVRSGEFYLVANDVALPFLRLFGGEKVTRFYRNNKGRACVVIARAGVNADRPLQPRTALCRQAAMTAKSMETRKSKEEKRRGFML